MKYSCVRIIFLTKQKVILHISMVNKMIGAGCVLWIETVESSCQGLFGYHDLPVDQQLSYQWRQICSEEKIARRQAWTSYSKLRAIHSLQKLRFRLSFVSSIQQLLYTEQDPSCITHDLGQHLYSTKGKHIRAPETHHAFPLPAFFEAKRWRTTESLLVARETSEEPEELLLLSDDLVSSDSSSSFGSKDGGGGIVMRKVSSIRMIWLKLGRMLGSSTQHDCTMNISSWGVSSGSCGRFCC